MENENKELTLFNGANNKIFCSMKVESTEEKKKLFNTLESCDLLLNDCVGQVIAIKDIYVEEKQVQDEEGNLKTKWRTIIFDANGQTYATGSYGIYNILRKIFSIYGTPDTWSEPLEVEVAKKNIGNGKSSLTLILK